MKKHIIIILILTFGYALFSFSRLGSFTNPNTFIENKEIIIENKDSAIISKLRYFTGHNFKKMKLYTSFDNKKYTELEDIKDTSVFSWNDIFINDTFHYLKIVLDKETALGEIALYDEQTLLKAITHNLNAYFEIDTIWWFRRFRIIEGEWFLHRYIIKTPSNLCRQKATWKYTLLKKLLIRLHEKYFLNDGGVEYAFSSVESHMWELPNFVEDNPVVRSIRKDQKNYNDSLDFLDRNIKYSKYVIYIDPQNVNFIESLTVKERKNLINGILRQQDDISVTKLRFKVIQMIIRHVIIIVLTLAISIPVVYHVINASLEATINNHRSAQTNWQTLYKEHGKITQN